MKVYKLVIFIWFLAKCQLLWGGIYFVAPAGNDASSRTDAKSFHTPWKTILKATHSVQAGDTIMVADGIYAESNITFSQSGTAEKWIMLTNMPGTAPVISLKGAARGIYVYKSSYIHINGFTIQGFNSDGISIFYGDYIICTNIKAFDNGNAGINVVDSDHIVIQDCELHHNGWKPDGDSGWGDGASINNHNAPGKMSVFRRNLCYANWQKRQNAYWDGNGYTLDCVGTDGLHIVGNNVFFNNGGAGLLVGATENIKLFNNVFFRNKSDVSCRNKADLYLIKEQTHNTIMKNNIIFSRPGIWTIDRYGGEDHDFIGNNLIWGEDGVNTQIWWLTLQRTNIDFWIANRAPQTLYGDPQFKAAPFDKVITSFHNSSWIAMDINQYNFQLKSGSKCINAGTVLTKAMTSGSGNQVQVENACFFFDGFNQIEGDYIQIGNNKVVQITKIDYVQNLLTFTAPYSISWQKGDGVSLPFYGNAPDLGAYEFNPEAIPSAAITTSRNSLNVIPVIEIRLTTSRAVIKNPSPLYYIEADSSFSSIRLTGKVPGNTFTGKLALGSDIADGTGYFLLKSDALITSSGQKGSQIKQGRILRCDVSAPESPAGIKLVEQPF